MVIVIQMPEQTEHKYKVLAFPQEGVTVGCDSEEMHLHRLVMSMNLAAFFLFKC